LWVPAVNLVVAEDDVADSKGGRRSRGGIRWREKALPRQLKRGRPDAGGGGRLMTREGERVLGVHYRRQ